LDIVVTELIMLGKQEYVY